MFYYHDFIFLPWTFKIFWPAVFLKKTLIRCWVSAKVNFRWGNNHPWWIKFFFKFLIVCVCMYSLYIIVNIRFKGILKKGVKNDKFLFFFVLKFLLIYIQSGKSWNYINKFEFRKISVSVILYPVFLDTLMQPKMNSASMRV